MPDGGNRQRKMAGATGLEPATSAVTGQRSNQLSYAPVEGDAKLTSIARLESTGKLKNNHGFWPFSSGATFRGNVGFFSGSDREKVADNQKKGFG